MRSWLAEGRVGATSLVWRAGWPQWRTAAEVFPQLAVATVTPPAASTSDGEIDLIAGALGIGLSNEGQSLTAGADALGMRRLRRKQSNNVTVVASLILAAVAVILIAVLIYVLTHQGDSTAIIAAPLRQLA
jgi:hypothetical protein